MRFTAFLGATAGLLVASTTTAAPVTTTHATTTHASTTTATTTSSTNTATASSNPDPPFQVTNLVMTTAPEGNTTIKFTVHDPSQYGKATAVCTGNWVTKSNGYPTAEYAPCGTSSFGWNMQSYTNASNFMLGVEHAYKDPNLGKAPYNYVENFAMGNVTETDLTCTLGPRKKRTTCTQKPPMIKMPVFYSAA